MDNDLQLYMTMSRCDNGTVPDDSGKNHDGKLQGTAKIVPDDLFGNCLGSFQNGDFVLIGQFNPNVTDEFTLEFWIKFIGPKGGDPIWGFSHTDTNAIGFVNVDDSGKVLMYLGVRGDTALQTTSGLDSALEQDVWTHLCFTYNGTQLLQFVNGRPQGNKVNAAKKPQSGPNDLKIGAAYAGAFENRIANVRIYSRALSQAEILADIGDDLNLGSQYAADVEASYPVDFQLLNSDGQAVLYTRVMTQAVALRIVNTSRGTLTVPALTGTAPAVTPEAKTWYGANHSFYLAFRPGTLWNKDIQLSIADQAEWRLVRDPWSGGEHDGYFLFRKEGATAVELKPFESRELQLQGITVDGRGGSRSTRVQLKYQNLLTAGSNQPLSDSRMNYLAIMDEQPSQAPSQAPVRVDWVGSNTILNRIISQIPGGNTLTVRLLNQSGSDLTLDTDAKITLHVPLGEPWGISKTKDEIGLKVVAPGWADDGTVPVIAPDFTSASWTIKRSAAGLWAKGEHVDVTINLQSTAADGITWLTVSYDGFQHLSDTVELAVVKSPLFITAGNVGVGTITPDVPLTIGDGTTDSSAHALIKGQAGQAGSAKHGMLFLNNTNSGIGAGAIHASDSLYLFRKDGSPFRILRSQPDFLYVESMTDLCISGDGKVGIGTTSPVTPLHVRRQFRYGCSVNVSGENLELAGGAQDWGGLKVGDLLSIGSEERLVVEITDRTAKVDAAFYNNATYPFFTYVSIDPDLLDPLLTVDGPLSIGRSVISPGANGFLKFQANAQRQTLDCMTLSPTGVLEVTGGHTDHASGAYGLLDSSGSRTESVTFPNPVSIQTPGAIRAACFYAVSDARIKANAQPLNASHSLAFIRQLNPVSFEYADKPQKGSGVRNGFLAQDVEQLRPNLVHRDKGMVPILEPFTEYEFEEGIQYRIATQAGMRDWKKGDAVPEGEKFVVEKAVDDLRSLDYESLFSVAVSAMQAQQSEIDALRAEMRALRRELAELTARDRGASLGGETKIIC